MDNRVLTSADTIDDIIIRYASMIYKLAYARTRNSADADDVVQEVYMRYIKSRTDFKDEQHRKAWLIKVTINCSKNLLTSAWFRRTTSLRDVLTAEGAEKSEVFYAVMALPVMYRTIIHLYYYEDYSVSEIAELLHMKEATVKTRLHRARRMLQKSLKGEFNDVQGTIPKGF